MAKHLVVLVLLFITVAMVNAQYCKTSKAIQNFGCNCILNELARKEFELGMEYLNASNHMLGDDVAMHGFGRMYREFWHKQLDYGNTIRKYIIKRGGQFRTLSLKKFDDQEVGHDHFVNEERVLLKFLELEKALNQYLIEFVHQCAAADTNRAVEIETVCRGKYSFDCMHPYQNMTHIYLNPDPSLTDFLDENFTNQKVERIKLLADLHRRAYHFYLPSTSVSSRFGHKIGNLDRLAIFVLDQEIGSKYS